MMDNGAVQRLIAAQGLAPAQMTRMPTEAERAEVMRVQMMQVRTQAANLASVLLQHRQTSLAVWDKWAVHIETYIMGDNPDDRTSASVRTGP